MSGTEKVATKKAKIQETPTEEEEVEVVEDSSPGSTQKSVKKSLKTINPFLSPKSATVFERSSSASKLGRSSLTNDERPQSARSMKKSQFDSNPSSPANSKRAKIDQISSPDKPKPKSQFGQQFFEENKKVSDQMRKQGSEYFDMKQQSKNLEQELRAMENRVKKLHKEDFGSLKRLEKTQQQCQEVVDNKLRHQDELIESEFRKQQKMADLANQRKQQMEDKMKLNEGILKSMINMMETKNNQKKEVQQILADENERYERETTEKNKIRDKIILEIQDLRERIVQGRKEKEEAAKTFALVTHHQEKFEAEKQKQDEINRRLEELIQQEEILLEKIRATTTLHEVEFQKMEKIFSMRVTADKPLDLP